MKERFTPLGKASERPPAPLAWLAGLSPAGFGVLVQGLFLLGMALPFLVAPMPLGSWLPLPRGFGIRDAVLAYLNNAGIALLLGYGLPRLEGILPARFRLGWASRLYLLFSAPLTGVLASPHGLPQGELYALLAVPLGMGEYLAFTLAALGRVRLALGLLLLLALYEGFVVGLV